ncbi:MAG TPA: DMT family transporter [Thermoplasmata archaeon]|nr:DMT family transporter [Thermoplasmata archaeon]
MSGAIRPGGLASPTAGGYSLGDLGLLGVLGVVWGIAYVFIREGILLGATPLAYAAARYALSAAAFAAVAAGRREAFPARRNLAVSAAVGGILVIGLYGGFLYWGEQYTTGGYASVLSTTAPILTVVIAYGILPNERLTPLALLGIAVGFVGAVVLVLPSLVAGPAGTAEGPLFVLGAFVVAALGSVLLRAYGGGRQGLWQIGTQFAVAGLLLGTASLLLPTREALPLTPAVLGALAALVVLSSVLGYLTYFALHHRVGPIRANAVTYLIPLVGVAVGTGVYGESVTPFEIAGFVIVLAGMTLLVRASRAGPATGPGGSAALPAGIGSTAAATSERR